MAYTIGAVIRVSGETEFSKKMSDIKKQMGYTKSESAALTSAFGKNDKSMLALSTRSSALKKAMALQTKAVEAADEALHRMKDQGVDPSSDGYQKMEQNLNNAKAALNSTDRELQEIADDMAIASENTNKLNSSFDITSTKAGRLATDIYDSGSRIKASMGSGDFGGIMSGTMGMISAIGAVGEAAIAAEQKLEQLVRYGANNADKIITESTKMGISTDTYQELEYASHFVDVEMSTMASAMSKITAAVPKAEDGFISLADGVKVFVGEGENLRSTEDIFYDVIDAIGAIDNATEQDVAAREIFGRGFMELKPLLEAGSSALKGYGKEAQAAGYIMSEEVVSSLGATNDKLDEMDVAISNLKNNISVTLAPAMEDLADAITEVANALSKVCQWIDTMNSKKITFNGGSYGTDEFGADMDLFNGSAFGSSSQSMGNRTKSIGGGGGTINIYPQSIDNATIDYIIQKANIALGGVG